jgi:hypothetical protein
MSAKGKSVILLNSTITASSAGERAVLLGFARPMGASAVVVRVGHLATMVRLSPYRWARAPVISFDA